MRSATMRTTGNSARPLAWKHDGPAADLAAGV